MNSSEAKKKLLLYRRSIDDGDPQFQGALEHALRDPDLAEWLREQRSSYDAIRSKLCEIEPPSGLAERIIRQRPIPIRRGWPQVLQLAAAIVMLAGIIAVWLNVSHTKEHSLVQGQEIVVKGEVLDMTCYIARNASGPKHAECARECIRKGLPVGIKSEDGRVYLLVGKIKPVNGELADYAAKTVTIRGRETMRDGFVQLQVEEIRKF